jgi:hypothetical protein
MIRQWKPLRTLVVLGILITGCPTIVSDPPTPQANCGTDDPRVGETAVLRGYIHNVQGTATIVSNCEIVIEHFFYDNVGLDVRVVGLKNNDRSNLIPLTGNIRDHGPYTDATLRIPLPDGVTLDDVPQISITCVSYGIDFGDATFQ